MNSSGTASVFISSLHSFEPDIIAYSHAKDPRPYICIFPHIRSSCLTKSRTALQRRGTSATRCTAVLFIYSTVVDLHRRTRSRGSIILHAGAGLVNARTNCRVGSIPAIKSSDRGAQESEWDGWAGSPSGEVPTYEVSPGLRIHLMDLRRGFYASVLQSQRRSKFAEHVKP